MGTVLEKGEKKPTLDLGLDHNDDLNLNSLCTRAYFAPSTGQ